MGAIIIGIIIGCVAVVGFIYSIFLFQEKGPILTNTYLLFSEEERKKMKIDIHKEYKETAHIYFLLSLAFLMVSLATLTLISWLFFLAILILIIVAVFALIKWFIFEKKNISS